MGIFIYESIAKSITKDEWEKVYEETLILVNAFPLAEIGTITYAGQKVTCAVRTKERNVYSYDDGYQTGWCASIDYANLSIAETCFLPQDLIKDNNILYDAGDPIMSTLPTYLNYNQSSEITQNTYSLWNVNTNGTSYHIYILAIACLIEDRLGEKAFVYGDITQEQCNKAVELANQYLDKPIHVPARCDAERLYKRIQKLTVTEPEKLTLFGQLYLGNQDEPEETLPKQHSQYTIFDYEALRFYKKGDTLLPFLAKSVERVFHFYHEMVKDDHYKYMMEDEPLYRCLLLAENSKRLFLRDTDWLHTFHEIENHPNSYKRYYPMVRVQLELAEVNLIVKALILNDEFYSYALTLSEKQKLKSTTCEEIKMSAQKNEYINEASATIYQLSQEEKIRLQYEAREDFYRQQNDMKYIMREQTAAINKLSSEKQALISERQVLISKKQALISENKRLLAWVKEHGYEP